MLPDTLMRTLLVCFVTYSSFYRSSLPVDYRETALYAHNARQYQSVHPMLASLSIHLVIDVVSRLLNVNVPSIQSRRSSLDSSTTNNYPQYFSVIIYNRYTSISMSS